MRKRVLSVLFSALLIFSLAFAANSISLGATANAKKVTLHFMDIMPGPDRDKVYQNIIAKFEAKNPNIHVELETVPWDQAHNKLVILGASKTMPDVIQVYPQWMSEFTSANWIINLDPYFAHYQYKNSFIPLVDRIFMRHDQRQLYKGLYSIPDGIMAGGLFYRTDWFKQAGIVPPKTWDDFFAAVEKLTDKSQNRYGLSYRGARAGFDQIMNYIDSVTHGQMYGKNGNCLLTKPKVVQAFIRYTDIYKKGWAPKDSINWGYTEMVQGFTSGLTAILNQTTEVVTTCSDNMKDGTWSVAPWPVGEDGMIYGSANYSTGYSIAANSQYKEEAWKFIAFLASPEINIEYCKGNTLIPVVKEAQKDPYFSQGPMKGFTDMMSGKNYALFAPWGYFPELSEFRESFMDAEVQKYLLNKQSAKDTMKHLADFLTKHQQEYMKAHPDVPVPQPIFINKK